LDKGLTFENFLDEKQIMICRRYPKATPALAILLFALTCCVPARPAMAPRVPVMENVSPSGGSRPALSAAPEHPELKGWDYVFDTLVKRGVDAGQLRALLADPRMPPSETIYFSLEPKESTSLYSHTNTAAARRRALFFYREYSPYFRRAYARYRVPESVVLAVLQIETGCGSFMGNSRIFYRLLRLGSAASPDNIRRNFEEKHRLDSTVTIEKVEKRAKWLEEEFLPHAAAVLSVANEMKVHPLELRGSAAGALGIPQFLPGHVARYGIDGDGDGKVNLFQPADAIMSVANYLHQHGWRSTAMARSEMDNAIRSYNNSDPYVSTVLNMALALETYTASAQIAMLPRQPQILTQSLRRTK